MRGSSDDTELERAEAKVAAEEKDLSEAQAKADETVAKFCGASETCIIALDRYGDVLSSTAPTVGDVTEAGADLADPGKDATKAAEAAVKAQEELRAADQELKDARAALKDVRATSGPSRSEESDPKVKATPHPLPPDDVVNRVEQAESELVSAQGGINDETPLVQASQQFNAAAVALEMSWLHLYAEAGCFADDQQKEAEAAAASTTPPPSNKPCPKPATTRDRWTASMARRRWTRSKPCNKPMGCRSRAPWTKQQRRPLTRICRRRAEPPPSRRSRRRRQSSRP